MDEIKNCQGEVCGNNPCTCAAAPVEEITTPEVEAEVSETEAPAEESAAQ